MGAGGASGPKRMARVNMMIGSVEESRRLWNRCLKSRESNGLKGRSVRDVRNDDDDDDVVQ